MRLLKRAVERMLVRTAGPLAARWEERRLVVLAYHNVVSDPNDAGGDRSLHLSRDSFAEQLDALAATHNVVPLDRALERLEGSGSEPHGQARPWAVVTFDDAYRGAMTLGIEELTNRGLPCTVFVSPGTLGASGFWWDRVPLDHRTAGAGKPRRELLLEEHAGRSDAILARARGEGWRLERASEQARPISEDELVKVAAKAGVTIGAHGWSHADMTQLDEEELRVELRRPAEWLRSRVPDGWLPVVAYPYGHCSPSVEAAARASGYRAAFTVSGGPFEPEDVDPYRLPRTNIPAGVSVDGFRLRSIGLVT